MTSSKTRSKGGRLQACNSFFAIVRAFEIGVAFELKITRQRVAVVVVAIDDKNASSFLWAEARSPFRPDDLQMIIAWGTASGVFGRG
jgi:hypothetical protein